MVPKIASALTVACLLSACSSPGIFLLVDVQTDLPPGLVFDRVEVEVSSSADGFETRDASIDVAAMDDALGGLRVAELDDLPAGEYLVLGRLLLGSEMVRTTERSIRLDAPFALTLTFLSEACTRSDEVCNGLDDDCDFVVDEGTPESLCADPSVVEAACVDAACVISTCVEDRLDCDADGATGCEVDALADDAHCGACGTICDGDRSCDEGACRGLGAYRSDAGPVLGVAPLGMFFPETQDGVIAHVDGFLVSRTQFRSTELVALDRSGAELWRIEPTVVGTGRFFSGPVADAAGNVYINVWLDGSAAAAHLDLTPGVRVTAPAGTPATRYMVRLDAEGTYVTHWPFDAIDVSGTDAAGNLYVSGRMAPMMGPGNAWFMRQLAPDGSVLWTSTVAGIGRFPRVQASCVDELGNYTVSLENLDEGRYDFGGGPLTVGAFVAVVVSRGADGAFRWSWRVRGDVHALLPGSDGGTTIVFRRSDGTPPQFEVERLAADGSSLGRFELPEYVEMANAAIGDRGDIYIAGTLEGAADFGGGLREPIVDMGYLVSYSSGGAYRFDRTFSDPASVRATGLAANGDALAALLYMTGEIDFGGGPRSSLRESFLVVFDD